MIVFKFSQVSILLCSIVIAGCSGSGGSSDSAGQGSSTGQVQIQSFEVDGTSDPLPIIESREPIDSQENGGRFHVAWLTSGSPTYTASLYVSKDGAIRNREIDPGDDVRFFRIQCSESSEKCDSSATFECVFRSDNRISCDNGELVDLTNWFDQLPQDAYIVLEATTSNFGSGRSVEVRFR